MNHSHRLRQGDNLDPTSLTIVTHLVAEDFVAHLKKSGVDSPKIKQRTDENGMLMLSNKKDLDVTIECVMNTLTFADDSDLLLEDR